MTEETYDATGKLLVEHARRRSHKMFVVRRATGDRWLNVAVLPPARELIGASTPQPAGRTQRVRNAVEASKRAPGPAPTAKSVPILATSALCNGGPVAERGSCDSRPRRQQKASVRPFVDEIFVAGRPEAVDELVAEDFEPHSWPSTGQPRDDLKRSIERVGAGLADVVFTIADLIAEDDRVAARLPRARRRSGTSWACRPATAATRSRRFTLPDPRRPGRRALAPVRPHEPHEQLGVEPGV